MTTGWRTVVAIAGLSSPPGQPVGSSATADDLIDLRQVPSVLDPQLAPDGRAVLYQLNQVDWTANRRPGHIRARMLPAAHQSN
jgi:hypothetical protein